MNLITLSYSGIFVLRKEAWSALSALSRYFFRISPGIWDNFKTYGQELAVMLIQFLQYSLVFDGIPSCFLLLGGYLFAFDGGWDTPFFGHFFSANSPISRAVFILDTTSATVTARVRSGLLSEAAVEGLESTFLAGARISSPCSAFHCLIVSFRLFSASLVYPKPVSESLSRRI
jgi:hypothetical protein